MRKALTDATIRALESTGAWREISDPGFQGRGSLALRITPAGKRIFRFHYRNLAGRQRRVTLGEYPALSLAQARERSRELSADFNNHSRNSWNHRNRGISLK